MSTTLQDQARKANAQKSTGPKTPEGKAKSSINALRHGLAGKGTCLTPELEEMLEERRKAAGLKIDRQDEHSVRMEDELLLASIRVDACYQARYKVVTERWDLDREVEAMELAAKLRQSPTLINRKLDRTLQGVSWKLDRLDFLIGRLEEKKDLSVEELGLSYDLLGVPLMERQATLEAEDAAIALQLLKTEHERLIALRDNVLEPKQAAEKALALLGVPLNETKALALLRRYEKENLNKYFRLMDMMKLEIKKGIASAAPGDAGPADEAPKTDLPTTFAAAAAAKNAERAREQAAMKKTPALTGRRDEPGDRTRGLSGSRESSGSSGSSTRMSATDVMRLRFSKKPQTPIRKK